MVQNACNMYRYMYNAVTENQYYDKVPYMYICYLWLNSNCYSTMYLTKLSYLYMNY